MPGGNRYSAFISYAHGDIAWARWLQSALETYRIPRAVRRQSGIARRIKPVFRDESEMGAAASLGEAVADALRASDKLIVICSPASQRSEWVHSEVAFYIELGRRDQIVLVLVEGTPETSFPHALLETASAQAAAPMHANLPLAADARPGAGQSLRARRNRVRLAVIAALLDLQPDELIRRHQQRQIRTLTIAAGVLLTVAGLMATLALVAVGQRNRAEAQERAAQLRLAESKVQQGGALILANRWTDGYDAFAEAREILDQHGLSSMPLGFKMIEAEQRSVIPYLYLRITDAPVAGLATSDDGTRLAVATSENVRVFDLVNDERLLVIDVDEVIDRFALSPDGSALALSTGTDVRLLSAASGELFAGPWPTESRIERMEFSPRAPALLMAFSTGKISAWDFEANELVPVVERDAGLVVMDLSADGSRLLVSWEDSTTEVCELSQWQCTASTSIDAGRVRTAALSHEGTHVVTGDGQFLRLWDAATGSFRSESPMSTEQVAFIGDLIFASDIDGDVTAFDIDTGTTAGYFPSPPTLVKTHAAFSRDRLALFTSYETGVLYWQLTFDTPPGAGQSFALREGRLLGALAVSPGGELIAVGDDQGTVRLLDGYDLGVLGAVDAHRGGVDDIAVAPDGASVLSVGSENNVLRWNLIDGSVESYYDRPGGKLTAIAFSNDGALLAVGGRNGDVSILDDAAGETNSLPSVAARVTSLHFSDDDSLLAIGTDAGGFFLWSAHDAALRHVGSTDTQAHTQITLVGTDEALYVGGSAELWDLASGQSRFAYGSRMSAAWSAGLLGQDLVFAGGAETVGIFDRRTAAEVASLRMLPVVLLDSSATAEGDLLVVGGLSQLQSFRWRQAMRRTELRRLLSARGEALQPEGRHALMAQWYFLHGFESAAFGYLERAGLQTQSLPGLMAAKTLLANDHVDAAAVHLARAVDNGEISPAYAALLQASATDSSPTPP